MGSARIVSRAPVGTTCRCSRLRCGRWGYATQACARVPGINIFNVEVATKRLGLLHELLPKSVRIAVLVNSANATSAEFTLRYIPEAVRALGLQSLVLNASTSEQIDAAFATLVRERVDALFIAADAFFTSRRAQFATLTARDRIPAAYADREIVEAGGLMSYGTDFTDMFRQVGVYVGRILKGEKPSDLPVVQAAKFATSRLLRRLGSRYRFRCSC